MQELPNFILIIIAGFIFFDLLIVFYILRQRRKAQRARFNHSFYQTQWQTLANNLQFAPNQALLEADKLFDHAMRDLGYEGTFVEKFQKAQKLLINPQPIWNAHKLRNQIAHEAGFQPKSQQIQSSVNAFRKGLIDFGVDL